MIDVDGLGFKYMGRKRPALREVTFRLASGEALLVLGPSGCGKSTLALCLNGAIPHVVEGELSGRVRVGGLDTRQTPMAALAQRVGIVFQDPEAQFCMLTVEAEVAFGLENLAVPRAEMSVRIDEALALVGLGDRRRERIERLSGGQKQRLALACVLALRPEVLVFDEPTAQLDPAGAADVLALLGQFRALGRHTLVIVEHRLDEMMHLVDQVLVLSQSGEVVAHGPPRAVLRHHGAWLMEAGVWLPQVSELALALGPCGVTVDPFPLTVGEAVEVVRPQAGRLSAAFAPGMLAGGAGCQTNGATTPLLEITGLSHRYPQAVRPALRDVTFSVRPGEFTALVGANGAGKSTLARHLVGLLTPPAGTVRLQGQDLRSLSLREVTRQLGYVFQYPEHQFVGVTLLDDVAYGLRRAGMAEAEAVRRARAMLDDFGLGALAPVHPFTLSHGEQRRLSVAAMLVLGQVGLLLDEPTFGQDRRNAALLLDKLSALAETGRAIVAITHDMRLVAERARRVLAMSEGMLLFDGPAHRLFADADLLRQTHLAPPPLWELSQRLGLPSPLVRVDDFVTRYRLGSALAGSVNQG